MAIFPFDKDDKWKDTGHNDFSFGKNITSEQHNEYTAEYIEKNGYINNPYWTEIGTATHTPCGYWNKKVVNVVPRKPPPYVPPTDLIACDYTNRKLYFFDLASFTYRGYYTANNNDSACYGCAISHNYAYIVNYRSAPTRITKISLYTMSKVSHTDININYAKYLYAEGDYIYVGHGTSTGSNNKWGRFHWDTMDYIDCNGFGMIDGGSASCIFYYNGSFYINGGSNYLGGYAARVKESSIQPYPAQIDINDIGYANHYKFDTPVGMVVANNKAYTVGHGSYSYLVRASIDAPVFFEEIQALDIGSYSAMWLTTSIDQDYVYVFCSADIYGNPPRIIKVSTNSFTVVKDVGFTGSLISSAPGSILGSINYNYKQVLFARITYLGAQCIVELDANDLSINRYVAVPTNVSPYQINIGWRD